MDSIIYGIGNMICNLFKSVGAHKLWSGIGCDLSVIKYGMASNSVYEIGLIGLIIIIVFLIISWLRIPESQE